MTDLTTIRIVVIGLAALTALVTVGAVILQLDGADAAQAWQLAGTLGGALAGILVQTRTGADPAASEAIEQAMGAAHVAGAAEKEADVTRYLAAQPPEPTRPDPGITERRPRVRAK